jgi:hypothetical protein
VPFEWVVEESAKMAIAAAKTKAPGRSKLDGNFYERCCWKKMAFYKSNV